MLKDLKEELEQSSFSFWDIQKVHVANYVLKYRALDRKYINQQQFDDFYSLAVRISSMLQKFISYLQKTVIQGERKK